VRKKGKRHHAADSATFSLLSVRERIGNRHDRQDRFHNEPIMEHELQDENKLKRPTTIETDVLFEQFSQGAI
jgi:hypothetical protein